MKQISKITTVFGIIAISALSGCSVKMGHVVPHSAFVYPNSNVKTLGPVAAEKSKTAFFVAPTWEFNDTEEVYNQALAKANGANLLIDYKEDTTFSTFLMFNTINYRIDGTAAKMDVGEKPLGQ